MDGLADVRSTPSCSIPWPFRWAFGTKRVQIEPVVTERCAESLLIVIYLCVLKLGAGRMVLHRKFAVRMGANTTDDARTLFSCQSGFLLLLRPVTLR